MNRLAPSLGAAGAENRIVSWDVVSSMEEPRATSGRSPHQATAADELTIRTTWWEALRRGLNGFWLFLGVLLYFLLVRVDASTEVWVTAIAVVSILAIVVALWLSARSLRLDGRRLHITRLFGRRESIPLGDIRELSAGPDILSLTLQTHRTVCILGLPPRQITTFTKAIAETAGLELDEAGGDEWTYRSRSGSASAPRVRESLRCPDCNRWYPSVYWFQNSEGKPLGRCYPCDQELERKPAVSVPDLT